MITLEQIMLLESGVQKAVERISALHQENVTLRKRLEQYESRIGELESVVGRFKDDQSRIEQGILNALSQLDELEDSVDDSRTEDGSPVYEQSDIDGVKSDNGESGSESGIVLNKELIDEDEIVEEDNLEFQENPSADAVSSVDEEPSAGIDSPKEAELDIF